MKVPVGTKTLREAASAVVRAMLQKTGVEERYDVDDSGTPYATINPDTVHVKDLPPEATAEEVAEHFYIKLHEIVHLVRRRDYDMFTDDSLKQLRPPYKLDNLFIDGPVDHMHFGKYKGADGWRDTGRVTYQGRYIPETVPPIDANDKQAVVLTAAGLVDCLVRQRTYPKSSRMLSVCFTKQAQGSVVPTLVSLAQQHGFVERFRELYLDAEADNLRDILVTINDLLKLWEPHLPTEQEQDGDDGADTDSPDGGEQCDDGEQGDGEQGDSDGEQDGEQSEQGGDQGGDQGSRENQPSLAEQMLDDHEIKATEIDRDAPVERVETHNNSFEERKPTDPANTGYIPAKSNERFTLLVGKGKLFSADGRNRGIKGGSVVSENMHYLKHGACIKGYDTWRSIQRSLVEDVIGHDASLRKLQMYLNAKYQAGKQYGQRSGKLNKRMVHRVVTEVPDDRWRERVFTKRNAKPDPRGTAISIGIDISGSMARCLKGVDTNRQHVAAGSVVKLSRALDLMKMDYEVFAYTLDWATGGVLNIIHKEFNEQVPTGTLTNRLTQFAPMGANADGESISMAGERLLAMPHNRKVMIVMSDGEPRAAGPYTLEYYHDPMAYDGFPEGGYLKSVVNNLTDQGVEIIGLGIDTDTVLSYYPHARSISAENLGEQLIEVLKELI